MHRGETSSTKLIRGFAVVIAVFMLVATPPTASAGGIPVVDAVANGFNSQNLVQTTLGTVNQVTETVQTLYEWMQTFALASLKKKLIDGLTDKIIGYAKGSGGAARYVTNWQTYLGKAALSGVDAANKSVAGSNVCSSFRKPLLQALGAKDISGGEANPDLDCDFAPGELEAINSNPANGSLETYRKMLEPQNNAYGAYWTARNQQSREAIAAKEAAQSEAIAGEGFLSPKSSDGTITTPGSVIKDLTSKAAGVDIDLIVNADQLKDLVAGLGSSLILQLTNSNDSGIAGTNLAKRQQARNNTRTATGRQITSADSKPNCDEVALSFIDDINTFDADKNGVISNVERDAAIASEQGIRDLCEENRNSATGNKNTFSQSTVAEVLAKRRAAKKLLDEIVSDLNKRVRTLEGYLSVDAAKVVKFDNPDYEPEAASTNINRHQAAYAKNVLKRICFEPVSTNGTITVTINDKKYTRPRAVSPCTGSPCAETTVNSIEPVTLPDGTVVPSYDPVSPNPVNVFFGGKTLRCTYSDGSEIDYYKDKLIPRMKDLRDGNELALEKLNALKNVIVQRSKSGDPALRAEKVQEVMDDFARIGSAYWMDPNDPDPTKPCNSDQDPSTSRDEPGCFSAPGVWKSLPDYTLLPNYITSRVTLGAGSNGVAQQGMISYYNGDYGDDPSNIFYDPAFDPDEADLVYEAAKGNFAVLGSAAPPAAPTEGAPDEAGSADSGSDTTEGETPDP